MVTLSPNVIFHTLYGVFGTFFRLELINVGYLSPHTELVVMLKAWSKPMVTYELPDDSKYVSREYRDRERIIPSTF